MIHVTNGRFVKNDVCRIRDRRKPVSPTLRPHAEGGGLTGETSYADRNLRTIFTNNLHRRLDRLPTVLLDADVAPERARSRPRLPRAPPLPLVHDSGVTRRRS